MRHGKTQALRAAVREAQARGGRVVWVTADNGSVAPVAECEVVRVPMTAPPSAEMVPRFRCWPWGSQ